MSKKAKPAWMKAGPNDARVRKIKSLLKELYANRGEDPITKRICEEIGQLVERID